MPAGAVEPPPPAPPQQGQGQAEPFRVTTSGTPEALHGFEPKHPMPQLPWHGESSWAQFRTFLTLRMVPVHPGDLDEILFADTRACPHLASFRSLAREAGAGMKSNYRKQPLFC